MKIVFFFIVLLLSIFYLLISDYCWAAILYLEPAQGDYYYSDNFIVNVKLDTEGECLNAVNIDLNFERNILKLKDFSKGDSIISLWLKEPNTSDQTDLISFAGGIPGGYCGTLPGDPGTANILGKIIFEVKRQENTATTGVKFLDTSQVLLNDGLGTKAKLSFKGAIFNVLSGTSEVTKREWQIELEKDKTPPEPFEINITKDPSIFEGRYFITFYAIDKQTGVDHYEIKEGKSPWEKINSPYLLKNQNLESIIKVKAVDKAGNERIIEYNPSLVPKLKPFHYFIIILAGTVCLLWHLITKLKRNKTQNRI